MFNLINKIYNYTQNIKKNNNREEFINNKWIVTYTKYINFNNCDKWIYNNII